MGLSFWKFREIECTVIESSSEEAAMKCYYDCLARASALVSFLCNGSPELPCATRVIEL